MNVAYLGGSELSVLVLAPLFLLANSDRMAFRYLNQENRYAAVTTSTFLALSALALHSILCFDQPLLTVLFNLIFWGLTVPNHYLFNVYMWTQQTKGKSETLVWLFAPLNVLVLFFADLLSIQLLAVLACVMAVLQSFLAHRTRRVGLRSI